jgi:hypothetical protein
MERSQKSENFLSLRSQIFLNFLHPKKLSAVVACPGQFLNLEQASPAKIREFPEAGGFITDIETVTTYSNFQAGRRHSAESCGRNFWPSLR